MKRPGNAGDVLWICFIQKGELCVKPDAFNQFQPEKRIKIKRFNSSKKRLVPAGISKPGLSSPARLMMFASTT